MKSLKMIVKSPVRNTAIILAVSLIVYYLFSLLSLYLARVMCAESFINTGSCHGTNFQMFISTILSDFVLLSRIIAELSILILVGQIAYRVVGKTSK